MYDSVIQLAAHAATDRGGDDHHASVITTGDFGVVPARLTLEAVQLSHQRSLLGYPGVPFDYPRTASSYPELFATRLAQTLALFSNRLLTV